MTRTPLFVLAFDHRNSLRRSFLGLADGATPEQSALCIRLKDAVAEALLRAADSGVGGVPGLLTDVEYGAAAARRARSAGVSVAVPVEASGRRELAWEYAPFSAPLTQIRPAYAKVLVRYNPTAPWPSWSTQGSPRRCGSWTGCRPRPRTPRSPGSCAPPATTPGASCWAGAPIRRSSTVG
jgi:myo-inositol catabolism protein IolC